MTHTDAEKTVLDNINAMMQDFSKAETKIAEFIIQNTDVAVNCNVSELANQSGVSDATVIRFCKHLGYEGYYQMRLFLSRDKGRKETRLIHTDESKESAAYFYRRISDSVLSTAGLVDDEVYKNVLQVLLNAAIVHLVAAGNTSTLTMYLGPRLEQLGIRCMYNQLPEHYIPHLDLAGENDVLLAISGSGTSKYVVKALELAKRKGIKSIVLTQYQHSPASRIADYLIVTAERKDGKNPLSYGSRLSEMVVLEVLFQMLEHALSRTEEEAEASDLLLSEMKL